MPNAFDTTILHIVREANAEIRTRHYSGDGLSDTQKALSGVQTRGPGEYVEFGFLYYSGIPPGVNGVEKPIMHNWYATDKERSDAAADNVPGGGTTVAPLTNQKIRTARGINENAFPVVGGRPLPPPGGPPGEVNRGTISGTTVTEKPGGGEFTDAVTTFYGNVWILQTIPSQ